MKAIQKLQKLREGITGTDDIHPGDKKAIKKAISFLTNYLSKNKSDMDTEVYTEVLNLLTQGKMYSEHSYYYLDTVPREFITSDIYRNNGFDKKRLEDRYKIKFLR